MYAVRPISVASRPSRARHLSRSTMLAAQKRSNPKADPSGRTPGFARPSRPSKPTPPSSFSQSSASTSRSQSASAQGKNTKLSEALHQSATDNSNNLLAPVHIPEDVNAILKATHPATNILSNSSIVVQRQIEMMNIMLGFEQANRYIIMDAHGSHIGYLAERDHGVGNVVARQMFGTHRSFTTHVFDRKENEVLRFHRPFSWISSRIKVYDAANPNQAAYSSSNALQNTSVGSISNQTSASVSDLDISEMRVIGEARQLWAPLRRKYNLFLSHNPSIPKDQQRNRLIIPGVSQHSDSTALEAAHSDPTEPDFVQFAYIDERFLSWDFSLLSEEGRLIASVNRNFRGFAREIFTDTGAYALRMDAAGLSEEPHHWISQTGQNEMDEKVGMTLDQRAVMLATAVSIDFDYFSRHSHGSNVGFFPFLWGGGGEAAGAEAGAAGAAGAAGEAGAAEAGAAGTSLSETESAARGAQEAARGYGAGEGPIAGAGSLAAYEAMQRSREQQPQQEQGAQEQGQQPQGEQQNNDDDDFWGGWGGGKGGEGGGEGGAAGGDGGDGGGISLDDFF